MNELTRLLRSIYESDLHGIHLEVTIVDDCSPHDSSDDIHTDFPDVRIIRNDAEMFASKCRNIGYMASKGDLIFFLDDDNLLDEDCIRGLVNSFDDPEFNNLGMIAPIMFYLSKPNRIWCAGVHRNMVTSITSFALRNQDASEISSKYMVSMDFPNAFMVRRNALEEAGVFNEIDFPIHYEESDLGARIRKNGYEIFCNTEAKVWHDILPPDGTEDPARLFHVHNEIRSYYSGRNRVMFHKKYSPPFARILYLMFFSWGLNLYYSYIIMLKSRNNVHVRIRNLKSYYKGVLDGLSGRSIA